MGYLPYRNQRFTDLAEIEQFDFANPPWDTGRGFLFVVDLEFPKEIHEVIGEMPFPPSKRKL